MDFDERLQRAIHRGQQQRAAEGLAQARQALTEEEYRSLHSRLRLELSEYIETCLKRLVDHFPSFDYSSVMSVDGWGAKISRDELYGRPLTRQYSHLELLIRPYSAARILEVTARGAIRNKEVLTRSQYQQLDSYDLDAFRAIIDQLALEFAEKVAAAG
ncbi:MAG TPA: hypothetical protein VL132_16480 [Planctomycetaceae bacterium]|jgi:hypothetical protein|nr:hypothetical protein [Planctomycetaceae bacterium]